MREKDYYGAIKGFCLKWNLPPVWDSNRITGTNLIYEVIKVINSMIIELREYEDRVDGKLDEMQNMITDFLDIFDDNLSSVVLTILTDWKDSGMLEGIINDALFNQKLDKSVFEKYKSETNEEINKLKDVYLLVGDSYLVGRAGSINVNGWGHWFGKELNIEKNKDYYELPESGMGFVRQGAGGNTFLTKIMTYSGNKDLITKIIIGGGHNDRLSTYSELVTAINNTVKYCIGNFKNATIYISFMAGNIALGSANDNIRRVLFRDVLQAYSNYYPNTVFIDTWKVVKNSSFFSDDNYHLNELGYKWVAKHIVSSLKGGSGYSVLHKTMKITNKTDVDLTATAMFNSDSVSLNIVTQGINVSDLVFVNNYQGLDYYEFITNALGEGTSDFPVINIIANIIITGSEIYTSQLCPLVYSNGILKIGVKQGTTRFVILNQTMTIPYNHFYLNSPLW